MTNLFREFLDEVINKKDIQYSNDISVKDSNKLLSLYLEFEVPNSVKTDFFSNLASEGCLTQEYGDALYDFMGDMESDMTNLIDNELINRDVRNVFAEADDYDDSIDHFDYPCYRPEMNSYEDRRGV